MNVLLELVVDEHIGMRSLPVKSFLKTYVSRRYNGPPRRRKPGGVDGV